MTLCICVKHDDCGSADTNIVATIVEGEGHEK